jgi:hypothetical protein
MLPQRSAFFLQKKRCSLGYLPVGKGAALLHFFSYAEAAGASCISPVREGCVAKVAKGH